MLRKPPRYVRRLVGSRGRVSGSQASPRKATGTASANSRKGSRQDTTAGQAQQRDREDADAIQEDLHPLGTALLVAGHQIAEQDDRQRQDRRGADALQCAQHEHPLEARRQAHCRARQAKQQHADEQQRAPTVQVGDRAGQGSEKDHRDAVHADDEADRRLGDGELLHHRRRHGKTSWEPMTAAIDVEKATTRPRRVCGGSP